MTILPSAPLGEESAPLSEYAQMGYVSGLVVMDETGRVLSDYHETGEAPRQLGEYLDSPALLDAALYPEKRYATRFTCADGSMVDLAAAGRRDAPGVVAAYYRTPVEYLDSFRLSIELMLSGYSPETSGTIVVTGGSRVVASNDETLIGGNAEEMAILQQIRQAYRSGELVRASRSEDSFRRYYGMMGCGRNFYVYVYMTEKAVFATTPQNMLFALIFYAVIFAFAKAIRFRTAQCYQEQQYRVQKEYAEKLRAANAELSAAVDQADRANAAKTSFLSSMSHDIRTPLNGVIGLLQIDDAHPNDIALLTANREKMKVAANHLLSLINDVLELSRIENGRTQLVPEPTDLDAMAHELETMLTEGMQRSGISFRVTSVLRTPVVLCDKSKMRQILVNLLGNAQKFTQSGGTVSLAFEQTGEDAYRFTVRDTGIGISRSFQEHMFEAFERERTSTESSTPGTGLGLSIVKRLVELMDGRITVDSTPGSGTSIAVTLFLPPADSAPADAPAQEAPASSLSGVRILLVEDNELNREIADTLLGAEGALVTNAVNGAKAVELFRSNPPGTFRLILMDIMMPVMDGLTAAKTIRALDRADAKTIPIFAMTANAFREDVTRSLDAGMNEHLNKPLDMEQLLSTIQKYL